MGQLPAEGPDRRSIVRNSGESVVSLSCRPLHPNRRTAWHLAALTAAALLSACGGGDPVSTPTSVGLTGGTPTVTTAGLVSTATTPSVGQGAPATFYVTGSSLENVVPSMNGCASIESSISNKSIVVQCSEVTTATTLTLTLTSQGQTLKQVSVPVVSVTSFALTRVNGVDVASAPPATLKFGDRVTYVIKGTNFDLLGSSGASLLASNTVIDGCVRKFTNFDSSTSTLTVHCDIADLAPSLSFVDAQGFPVTNGQQVPNVSATKPVVTLTYANESDAGDTFDVAIELQTDVAPLASYNFLYHALPAVGNLSNSSPSSATPFYVNTVVHETSVSGGDTDFLTGGFYITGTSPELTDQTGIKYATTNNDITLEFKTGGSNLSNTAGTVAALRYGIFDFFLNPQYVINVGNNGVDSEGERLYDDQLAVFGVITDPAQLTNMVTKVRASGVTEAPRADSSSGSPRDPIENAPTARYKISAVSVSRP
jgi:cyclophilin family peptidyl-prolyl cis-trans isomerase